MNDRIKELTSLAGIESADFPYKEFGMPFEQEKFAELIIKECAEACANVYKNSDPCSRNISKLFSETVLKHFGVA